MFERAPTTNAKMGYDEAFLYCLTLIYKDHKDWRVPQLKELEYLHGIHYYTLNELPFHAVELQVYYLNKLVIPVRGELE